VISEYGPCDLEACYYHTNQDRTTRGITPGVLSSQKNEGGTPGWMEKALGKDYHRLHLENSVDAGAFIHLIGAHPDERPDLYAKFSPIHYVHPGCPPTLLIQGEDDMIAPSAATRALYGKLRACGVPAVCVIFPHADHAFDLLLPEYSPTAQSALYEIERFLAVVV
jgi:acetyl esterase/lipase